MPDADWYEVVNEPALLQGDVLLRCPVFLAAGPLQWPASPDVEVRIRARVFDLVVMTQSCDLANAKVEEVLLAQLVA
jgi:hypothetical protein